MSIDYAVFNFFYTFANQIPYLEWVYVFLASYLPYFIAAIFIYELLKVADARKKFFILLLTALAIILSRGLATYALDFFLHRARPFIALGISPLIGQAATSSFPSGHMAFLAPIALASFLIDRRLGIWLSSFAFVVGLARIAVGVHWPSDVLGGIMIGALSYFLIYKLIPKPEAKVQK